MLTRFAELVGNSAETPASLLTANPSGSGWTPGEHLTSQAGELDVEDSFITQFNYYFVLIHVNELINQSIKYVIFLFLFSE